MYSTHIWYMYIDIYIYIYISIYGVWSFLLGSPWSFWWSLPVAIAAARVLKSMELELSPFFGREVPGWRYGVSFHGRRFIQFPEKFPVKQKVKQKIPEVCWSPIQDRIEGKRLGESSVILANPFPYCKTFELKLTLVQSVGSQMVPNPTA